MTVLADTEVRTLDNTSYYLPLRAFGRIYTHAPFRPSDNELPKLGADHDLTGQNECEESLKLNDSNHTDRNNIFTLSSTLNYRMNIKQCNNPNCFLFCCNQCKEVVNKKRRELQKY